MTFGEKIKFLRTRKSITQAELAKATGVSLRTIINYETYNKVPHKRDVCMRLSDALDVNESFLTDNTASVYDEITTFNSTDKINALLFELTKLFNSKDISKSEKEKLMFAIFDSYRKSLGKI